MLQSFLFLLNFVTTVTLADSPIGSQISCIPEALPSAAPLIPVDGGVLSPEILLPISSESSAPSSREFDFQESRARVSLSLTFTPEADESPTVLGTLSIAKTFFERQENELISLMMVFYRPTLLKVRRASTGLELSATPTSQGSPRLRLLVNESPGNHPAFTLTCAIKE